MRFVALVGLVLTLTLSPVIALGDDGGCPGIFQRLSKEKLAVSLEVVAALEKLDEKNLLIVKQMDEDDVCRVVDCLGLDAVFVKALAADTLLRRQIQQTSFWTMVGALGAVGAALPIGAIAGWLFGRRPKKPMASAPRL